MRRIKEKHVLSKLLILLLCLTAITTNMYEVITAAPTEIDNVVYGDLVYTVYPDTKEATVTAHKNADAASGVLVIPETMEYDSETYTVTVIGYCAFYNHKQLTGLVLPNTIKEIDDYAFFINYGMKGDLVIPDSVTRIGVSAFRGAGFDGGITIGNSVQSIGEFAFQEMYYITGDLIIPESVEEIGVYAFELFGEAGNVNNVEIYANIEINNTQFSNIYFTKDLIIAGKVKAIGDNAFSLILGNDELVGNLIIGGDVASIGNEAFWSYNWEYFAGFGGSVTIGDNVTSIGESAFRWMPDVTGDLIIPASVQSIGVQAFFEFGCNGKVGSLEVYGPANLPSNLFMYSGFTGDLIVDVETIGDDAFYRTTFGGTLTIGENVTSIGIRAFLEMKNVSGNIVIPDSVQSIGDYAFYGSNFSDTIILGSGLTNIGQYAFAYLPNIEGEITIPDHVINIGSRAFMNTTNITRLIHKKLIAMEGSLPEIYNPPVPYPDTSDYESTIQASEKDVMLQKSATWTNDELTEAEIQIDFGRAEVNSRMDIIFVLDYSDSMLASLSTQVDGITYLYPRSFVMDDVMQDSIDIILDANNEGYDNRIAVTAFGSDAVWSTDGFSSDKDEIKEQLKPVLASNYTNYGVGLSEAIRLIEQRDDTDREVAVIFISDGAPYLATSTGQEYGLDEAQELRDMGVKVYPLSVYTYASSYLKDISYDGKTAYEALNSKSVANIMEDVLQDVALNDIPKLDVIVEDTLSEYFAFDTGTIKDISLSSNAGTAVIKNDKVTWDLTGCDAGKAYSLTIKVKLSDETSSGELRTNNELIADNVTANESPILERYFADYIFESTSDKELPESITSLTPSDNKAYRNHSEVEVVTFTTKSIKDDNGTWYFKGWDYTTQSIDGEDITFTGSWEFVEDEVIIDPETQDITITKIWEDNNSKERPDCVDIILYANNKELMQLEVTKSNNWKSTISDLPIEEDGEIIVYTIKEINIPRYYKVSYDQETFTVTNKKTTLEVGEVPPVEETPKEVVPPNEQLPEVEIPTVEENHSSIPEKLPSKAGDDDNQTVVYEVVKTGDTTTTNLYLSLLLAGGLILAKVFINYFKKQ